MQEWCRQSSLPENIISMENSSNAANINCTAVTRLHAIKADLYFCENTTTTKKYYTP